MLDMLGNEVKKNDVVAYVYPSKQGKTCVVEGTVKKVRESSCTIFTENGKQNVKNIIKLRSAIVQKKQNGLLQFIRKIFK